MRIAAGALATALLLGAAAPALAAGRTETSRSLTARQLRDAESSRAALLAAQQQQAARAEAAQAQERRLGEARAAAAAKLRAREEATAAIATQVADLAARMRAAQARLETRGRDLAPMLPLIERLSLFPSETLLAVKLPAEDALRGVLVLNFMARQLQTEAVALRREQADIATLQAQLETAARQLGEAQAAQAAEAAALDARIAAARGQEQEAEDAADEAARRGAAEASRADTLRAAIARIDAEQQAAEARARADLAAATRQKRDADAARARLREAALVRPAGPGVGPADSTAPSATRGGGMTAPVAGTVVRGFGEGGDGGPATGLSYQAPPAARVVSPCGGRVKFAGPFRSYGQLMIVDCGAGDLFVLAGLERLDARVGQALQPGEPVGVMPGWDPQAAGARPSLYVELRRAGQPVNPAPFLRAKG